MYLLTSGHARQQCLRPPPLLFNHSAAIFRGVIARSVHSFIPLPKPPRNSEPVP